MRISIVGTGYVGLPVGAGLASRGHDIVCVDIDSKKVDKINNGESPIYEKNLPEMLKENVSSGKLRATTDTEKAVEKTDVTFLSVGTPVSDDGSINLDYIKDAAGDVGEALQNKESYHLVVVKSTVVPETTENEIIPILEEKSGKKAGEDFGVCMNPEFLREGSALNDFLNPDRIIIGEYDEKSGAILEEVYESFEVPIIRTSLEAAELIKYGSNSLLATKISFINELGNLCKELEMDVYEVADGIGMDKRISRDFLDSGSGFGGSCFPKDVRALVSFMKEKNVEPRILQSTIDINIDQKTRMVDLLEDKLGILEGSKVAVLGLSFKPDTDDIRNSPAIPIIEKLEQKNADVYAYDPMATENMKERYEFSATYCENYKDALEEAEAALLVTNWNEFDDINLKDLKSMKNPLILEGRKTKYELPEEFTEGITWP